MSARLARVSCVHSDDLFSKFREVLHTLEDKVEVPRNLLHRGHIGDCAIKSGTGEQWDKAKDYGSIPRHSKGADTGRSGEIF